MLKSGILYYVQNAPFGALRLCFNEPRDKETKSQQLRTQVDSNHQPPKPHKFGRSCHLELMDPSNHEIYQNNRDKNVFSEQIKIKKHRKIQNSNKEAPSTDTKQEKNNWFHIFNNSSSDN